MLFRSHECTIEAVNVFTRLHLNLGVMFTPFRVAVWTRWRVYKFALERVCVFAGEHVDLIACQLVGELLRGTSSHVLVMTSCPDNVPPSLHVGVQTCLQDAGVCSTVRAG